MSVSLRDTNLMAFCGGEDCSLVKSSQNRAMTWNRNIYSDKCNGIFLRLEKPQSFPNGFLTIPVLQEIPQ
jgi:hypothetical protein